MQEIFFLFLSFLKKTNSYKRTDKILVTHGGYRAMRSIYDGGKSRLRLMYECHLHISQNEKYHHLTLVRGYVLRPPRDISTSVAIIKIKGFNHAGDTTNKTHSYQKTE